MPYLDIGHAKFRVDMSIFGKHIAPKPNLLMTSFFRLQFWAFLDPTQKQKWPFWNPEIKLVQKHSFYSKIPIQKFAFMWPEVVLTLLCHWLTWGEIAKWYRFLNSTCKIGYKSCAACPKNNFWFWWLSWHFVTWSWPWPVLCMIFMLTWYLY